MFGKKHKKPVIAGQYSLDLDGSSISYILRRSSRSKYLRLEIRPGTGLLVTAPKHADIAYIEDFIERKRHWITRKMTKYNRAVDSSAVEIKDGATTEYMGNSITIVIQHKEDKPAMVILEKENLIVNLNHSGKDAGDMIEDWFKFQINIMLKDKLEFWSNTMQIHYQSFRIRGQKTRWGSCSRKGNLSFNWKLVKTPEGVIDYVVIHELAHLKEMNHSPKFWKLVAKYCPDYKIYRRWLRNRDELLAV
jgi:predicted metal-dependent hydrolase